jgi:predicted DNA-binding protein
LTIRIPDEEKAMIKNFAEFNGKSVSSTIRGIVLEKLEDEYDMRIAKEYESEREHTTHSWRGVKEELGL